MKTAPPAQPRLIRLGSNTPSGRQKTQPLTHAEYVRMKYRERTAAQARLAARKRMAG